MLEHPALLPQAASQSSGVAQATSSTSNDKLNDNRSGVVHRYSMWSELPQCVCIFRKEQFVIRFIIPIK